MPVLHPDHVVREHAADLAAIITRYPDLFPPHPFDHNFPARLAEMSIGCVPADTTPHPTYTRHALWICALDYLIDHVATTTDQVQHLTDRCDHTAAGHRPHPDDHLTAFLAELRTDLARTPEFAACEPLWRSELHRMVGAMSREWHWKLRLAVSNPTSCRT